MAPNGKSDPATRTAKGNGVSEMYTPFQNMLRTMAMVATADSEEGAFSGDDLNAILSADTEEEMWDADERGPLNFQHLAGCDIEILNLTVKYSRGGGDIKTPFIFVDGKGESRKMYLLATLRRVSTAQKNKVLNLPKVGETFQANTSARYVAAKLWWHYGKGLIDPEQGRTVMCHVEETDLGDGTGVLKLKRMPTHPVSSTAE